MIKERKTNLASKEFNKKCYNIINKCRTDAFF